MFYVVGKGWVAAGDKLCLESGKTVTVTGSELEKLEKPIKVYNLEVLDNHTYFVGDKAVLVHNVYKQKKADYYVANDGTALDGKHVKLGTQYETDYNVLCYEIGSGKNVKQKDIFKEWDDFLGESQTDIDPFTGQKSKDRIWSADGKRSIRFGDHEADSLSTKNAHYHMETWFDGWVLNVLQRINMKG